MSADLASLPLPARIRAVVDAIDNRAPIVPECPDYATDRDGYRAYAMGYLKGLAWIAANELERAR